VWKDLKKIKMLSFTELEMEKIYSNIIMNIGLKTISDGLNSGCSEPSGGSSLNSMENSQVAQCL
jgi:hypothetical protein